MKTNRTFWYVDTENVHNNFEGIIPQMHQHDRVYFFYSDEAKTISFDILSKLAPKQLYYYFIPVTITGYPNAMDFAMCIEMGRLSKEFPNVRHTFISNDNGFMSAVFALRRHDINSSMAHPEKRRMDGLGDAERRIVQKVNNYVPVENKNRYSYLNELCIQEGFSYAKLKPYVAQ